MLLLGHLAKVQGLKGEFILYPRTDSPESISTHEGLLLAPPSIDLSECGSLGHAKCVNVRSFRWHKGRPCMAFDQMPDRTAAEPFKGWSLWVPEASIELQGGESFRHDWIGCQVFVGSMLVGEVLGIDPSPGGYDMIRMKDMRPGRHGVRDIPYIKAWVAPDLQNRRILLDPPPGLLDVGIL